ncbi:hypothetical protein ACJJTC_018953 [Scirpophaga incertulas]
MVKTRSQSKNMIGGTSAGSASSKTSVVAQRLALEAQHARRVAEIEMGQIQAEREERARAAAAERAAVDAELRADIAALESRSNRGSRASHAPSQTSAQYVENWVKCHSNIKSCTQFQVELNGHASAKEGLSPNLAEVSMPPPAPLLFQCDAPKAGSTIEPNIATTTHACFQVELNGHASAKEGLSPHLAEVSMPPPAPLLFQCGAPKAGNTIEPNIATTTTVKKSGIFYKKKGSMSRNGPHFYCLFFILLWHFCISMVFWLSW